MKSKITHSNFSSRNEPFFSVIIPVYNRKDMILRAVNSVIGQTFKDFELLVVDDGSNDGTHDVLDAAGIPHITKTNGGVSSARNAGLRSAKGKFIAFLDSDDLWLGGKLEKQYDYIRSRPDIRVFQSDEIWVRRGVRVNPCKIHKKKSGDIFTDSLELCLVSPSASVLRRDVFDVYGLFDEKMPVCEDYDLWLRISAYEQIGLLDEKLIVKYGGSHPQLSSSEWGIDRFRIYSMMKFLNGNNSAAGILKIDNLKRVLVKKIQILRKGCIRHGRDEFAERLSVLIESIESNSCNTDLSFLLQK